MTKCYKLFCDHSKVKKQWSLRLKLLLFDVLLTIFNEYFLFVSSWMSIFICAAGSCPHSYLSLKITFAEKIMILSFGIVSIIMVFLIAGQTQLKKLNNDSIVSVFVCFGLMCGATFAMVYEAYQQPSSKYTILKRILKHITSQFSPADN